MNELRVVLLKNQFVILTLPEITTDLMAALLERKAFFCLCNDEDEKSLICENSNLPTYIECSEPWYGLKIVGPIPFELSGILVKILQPIADVKCSTLVSSTYSTDYIFFQSDHLEAVKTRLTAVTTFIA